MPTPTISHGTPSHLLQRIWPFALLVVVLMLAASSSIYMLSSVRGFVAGESLWSKAQKNAIYSLSSYAESASAHDLAQYKHAMQVPLGDAIGRDALEARPINLDLARKGFEQGLNHPDDVASLIWLLRTFKNFSWMQEPIAYWKQGDQYLKQLEAIAQEIQRNHESGKTTEAHIAMWKREIDQINNGASPAAKAFSDSLGHSSRAMVILLLSINCGLALALVSLWSWNTWRLLVQKQQIQSVLDAEKERAEVILAALGDAVITTDAQGLINYINPVAIGLLGANKRSYTGRTLKSVLQFHAMDTSFSSSEFLKQLLGNEITIRDEQTHWLRREDHGAFPVKVMGSSIIRNGETVGAVIVLRDVSREQQYMDQLSWNSRHDSLTGLENRAEFERRLQRLLNQGLHKIKPCTLLYIDLDQFKLINETSCHAAGDEVLCEVARMLASNLRESDCVARIGGDEFGVLLENCSQQAASAISEKLRRAAEKLQVQWGTKALRTGFSVGLVHIPLDANNAADLLRMADMACYQAKERGRNKIFVYSPADGAYTRYVSEMEWVTRIRSALEEDRFCLYAQSIAPLQKNADEGLHFEVLLRLRDEQGQIIPPGAFIPAAERYGIMPSLDRWVVSKTLQSLAARPADAPPIDTCAINLSGPSLDDEDLLEFLQTQMQKYGIAPQALCFEITETSAIANLGNATRLIQSLQATGCRFALDDFGAGMSSLTYLKQLPVDYLKIDGGFVRDMLQDPSNHAMVEMINRIGHILGKKTVAEFVESREIAEALKDMGVDFGQGYSIARPVPMNQAFFALSPEQQLPEWCGAMAMS